MLFMPIQISKKIQKQGLLLYLFGTLVYFDSWLVLILYPGSFWSKSTFGVLPPAYTPVISLIEIGLKADTFYFNLPYKRWGLMSLSIVFLTFHNINAFKLYF